jgi:hypothetical protein
MRAAVVLRVFFSCLSHSGCYLASPRSWARRWLSQCLSNCLHNSLRRVPAARNCKRSRRVCCLCRLDTSCSGPAAHSINIVPSVARTLNVSFIRDGNTIKLLFD